MEGQTRIVLGLEAHHLAEEVVHFLDRTGGGRVIATASDGLELARVARERSADVVVASPRLLPSAGSMDGIPFVALDTSESVAVLKEALQAGARGFYLWPSERHELAPAPSSVWFLLAVPRP